MTYKIPHPTSWPRCYLEDRADYLPGRAGVYAVMDARGHIYYIGKAKNLTIGGVVPAIIATSKLLIRLRSHYSLGRQLMGAL